MLSLFQSNGFIFLESDLISDYEWERMCQEIYKGIIMEVATVSDASFDKDVLASDTPVLVDFWAEWCGPCRQIAPILDEIAADYAGKLRVVKINIDENPQVTERYGVRTIPTLMLFINGEAAATQVGVQSKTQLAAWVDGAI